MSRGRKLASDTIIYGTFTILQRFLTFFMMPLYANYLDKGDYGNLTNIFSMIAVMMVIYSFGFENAFYRFYNESGKKKVFSTSILFVASLGVVLSAILILLNPIISPLINDATNTDEMVLYASIVLFIDIIMLIPFASMRMERKTVKFSIYKFTTIVIAIAFNIYFIAYQGKSAEYAFISQMIASICGVILVAPIILKKFKFEIDISLFKEMMRFALPTVPAAAATILLRMGDHILIPHLIKNGDEALAEYGANYKLALPMMMFVTTFDYAWKPFYMNSYKQADAKQFFSKVLEIFVFISGFVFLLVGFFIDEIVNLSINSRSLLPEEYHSGLAVIPFAMGGYFFLGLNNYFSMGLNIEKQTKYLPRAIGTAMIFNVIANIIFIPIYGYIAAAWITLISYMIAAITLYFISNRIYPMNYRSGKIFGTAFICLLLYSIGISFESSFQYLIDSSLIVLFLLSGFYLRVVDFDLIKRILKRKKAS